MNPRVNIGHGLEKEILPESELAVSKFQGLITARVQA